MKQISPQFQSVFVILQQFFVERETTGCEIRVYEKLLSRVLKSRVNRLTE